MSPTTSTTILALKIMLDAILLPTTISDIIFQLIIAKLPRQKVGFGGLVRIHTCMHHSGFGGDL